MKLNENIIEHIKQEAERIHHGKLIIEINDTAGKVDVVTESRERFTERKAKKEG